jgi:iron complex transport system permease protein
MKRIALCFGMISVGVLVFFAWTLVSGPVDVSLRDLALAVLDPDNAEPFHSRILWELRFPRAMAAVLAGVALSVSGLCLQTVFRNPLCGPYVLGISSGASLGVAVALLAGFGFGALGVLGAASVGAILVTQVVLVLASRFRNSSVLLVAGLLVGYFVNALVNVLVSGADAESLQVYVSWGLGSFGRLTLGAVPGFAIAVLVGLVLVVSSMRYLNAIHMGDDFARGLGVRVGRSRICVLLGSSILAGAATAYCGPVAFIGIAVPHLAFMLFRTTDHRVLLPAASLCGALLALVAGLFPVSVPLNAVLSIIGVPVILYVLLHGNRNGRAL